MATTGMAVRVMRLPKALKACAAHSLRKSACDQSPPRGKMGGCSPINYRSKREKSALPADEARK
jgi:hypothetical protein